jgi:CHASE3 domain sensor protein
MILQRMNGAPPLVYFALGALYYKIGNHKAAINHLSYVIENETSDESNYHYATPELKEYVKILREIEREPTKAPQTSAAIRALERTRRNRGKSILEESRKALDDLKIKQLETAEIKTEVKYVRKETVFKSLFSNDSIQQPENNVQDEQFNGNQKQEFLLSDYSKLVTEKVEEAQKEISQKKNNKEADQIHNRKPITEVLHDIYDR